MSTVTEFRPGARAVYQKHLRVKPYPVCAYTGCRRDGIARGYCRAHLRKLIRSGELQVVQGRNPPVCTTEGCDGKPRSKGLCNRCYMRAWMRTPRGRRYSTEYWHGRGKFNPNRQAGEARRHAELAARVGLTPNEYRRAIKSWTRAIRERDGHACQHCGTTKSLHVHHILFKTHFPEHALDLDNGILLCRECHKAVHAHPLNF